MPKNCSFPHCGHQRRLGLTDRQASYHRFPSQDKERFQQWLLNMKRKNWAPTPYQYLCSDHFTPDSFERRWGVRYLKPNAVPTIFYFPDQTTKTKAAARTNGAKRPQRASRKAKTSEARSDEGVGPAGLSVVTAVPILSTVMSGSDEFAAIQVIGAEPAAISSAGVGGRPPSEAMEAVSAETGPFRPYGIDSPVPADCVLTELPPFDVRPPVETVRLAPPLEAAIAAATLSSVESLQVVALETVAAAEEVQAYGAPSPAFQRPAAGVILAFPPAAAGLPALEYGLPAAAPVIAAVETVVTSPRPEPPPAPPDTAELRGEHSYHKNDLSARQLGEIMLGLQKKVKILHQRERRNSARLRVMENLVQQLRKENVLSEEKLKLLEMTSLQAKTQGVGHRRTVTIICHEDDDTIIYALPDSVDEDNSVVIEEGHIKLEKFN